MLSDLEFLMSDNGISKLKINGNKKICTGCYGGKNGEKSGFILDWHESYVYLLIGVEAQELIDLISKKIKNPDIKGENVGWFFRTYFYLWFADKLLAWDIYMRLEAEEKINSKYGYKNLKLLTR